MELPRRGGILLHVTSLPGGAYSGDLGSSAYRFADFLARAGQAWWQTLPLNPIDAHGSPYSSVSSFACEPAMISPDALVADGLLSRRALRGLPRIAKTWKSEFVRSRRVRAALLRQAYDRFRERRAPRTLQRAFRTFLNREQEWLDDYTLFSALRERHGTADWTTWPKDIARRQPEALEAARDEMSDRIDYFAFEQFLFDRQWRRLRAHCKRVRVGIIGDLPIFVAHRSADVWANPEAFLLYANGRLRFVAGAPPDAFNANGQRWGNALYDWDHHERTGFSWWKARLRRQLALFDLVRLDHFIGFERYWRIPSRSKTARGGRWIRSSGRALLEALRDDMPDGLPFVAEDLGAASQEVWDLRDDFELPGMTVLQFAFGEGSGHRMHRPHAYPRPTVAFTGTHDSDTLLGWYRDLRRRARSDATAKAELARAQAYFGARKEGEVVDAAIRALYTSPANTVIVPMQDVLGLDGRHRMNRPGIPRGNWTWRLEEGRLDRRLARKLHALAEATDRSPET